jgi:hypothetical protein
MKKTLILVLLLSQTMLSHSQNSIYVGNKEYPSTPTWEFSSLSLNFGRSSVSTGVILVTTSEDQFVQQYFGSVLYIYLQNGKQLVFNKIANDRLNGDISAAYSVSSINLKMLKNSDIRSVRYTIKSEFGRSNNYSVANEIVEYKEIEMPVPEAEYMSEMDKLRKNIQSKSLGISLSDDPFMKYKSNVYYYRNETIKISKGSIKTSTDINDLY